MSPRAYRLLSALLCLTLIAAVTRAAADTQPASEPKYLRFVEDNDGGGRLESSIVTYRNPAGVTVHLVAAVHVGEHRYYEDLNKTFAQYDALLYEMVKPKGMAPPAPGVQSDSAISFFQRMLKDVLELEFQLDAINYRAANFVHADLDAETFVQLQSERGESMFTLMLQAVLSEMSRPQKPAEEISLTEVLVALTSPDRARHFKMILGRQFEDIESKVAGLDGPGGSVLVTERNKAAIRVLKETLGQGKKDIGIFYGAAHMIGLSQQLKEMGFESVGTEWRVAWNMTPQEGDVVLKVVKQKPETQPSR